MILTIPISHVLPAQFGWVPRFLLFMSFVEERLGKIKPVIDQVYPLSQTAEAHRHYETGHAKGRVVISLE